MVKVIGTIDTFINFFKKNIDTIRSIDINDRHRNELFKKILYVGVIDSLSKTVVSNNCGNAKRFRVFIEKCTYWKYMEYISVPHLLRYLEKIKNPDFKEVEEIVLHKLNSWDVYKNVGLEHDLQKTEIEEYWPSSTNNSLINYKIDQFQHVSLFYKYRTYMIHELRQPGYGIESPSDDDPFYHQMRIIDGQNINWELVYPVKFFDNICIKSLEKLKDYYISECIDPYSSYTFGTYWLEDLNQ